VERIQTKKIGTVVHRYLAVLTASITTVAAANLDDAFLLTLFFAWRIPTRRIVAGQYAGFAAIVVLRLMGAWCVLGNLAPLDLAAWADAAGRWFSLAGDLCPKLVRSARSLRIIYEPFIRVLLRFVSNVSVS